MTEEEKKQLEYLKKKEGEQHTLLLDELEKSRNELKTDKLDMSYGEIISTYERGDLIISPEFQRHYRWKSDQKTRFVESILLGIPTPPIFVAENNEGRWELVDGLQRISTVTSFLGELKIKEEDKNKNNWAMEEGDIIKNFRGYKFESLPYRLQLHIRRAPCRIEIIKWDSAYDMRYELFKRLNTGGTPLTQQEIRNCIFRGVSTKFNDFLKKLADNKKFKTLMEIPEKQIEELYLEELVLRFVSIYQNEKNIRISMGQYMTEFMKQAINNEFFSYPKYEQVFEETVNILSECGSKIFRSKNKVFSTGYYDVIMLGIAENINQYKRMPTHKLMKIIEKVYENGVRQKISRGGGNNSVQRVRNRIREAKRIFGSL